MKLIYLLPILLLVISCKNEKEEKFKKDIIGEWKFIKEIDSTLRNETLPELPFRDFIMSDFICNASGAYKEKSGFWEVTKNATKDSIHIIKYCGWKSSYAIKGDSVFVLDQCLNKWRKTRIHSIHSDTLIYNMGKKRYCLFKRKKYKLVAEEKYDQIIVSSSGCYGSCPVANISVAATGKIVYNGERFNLKDGNYNGKITQQEYIELQDDFKKAGVDTLKTDYSANWTDDQTITVTFIKNGKIYKTVSDYGFQSPSELIAACTQVRFLYQQLKLKRTALPFPELREGYIGFDTADKSLSLDSSEQFYLITELERAKPVNILFKSKFTLQYGDYYHKKFMQTDGRYYKFAKEEGGKTIDLGYNFIERDQLGDRFAVEK